MITAGVFAQPPALSLRIKTGPSQSPLPAVSDFGGFLMVAAVSTGDLAAVFFLATDAS